MQIQSEYIPIIVGMLILTFLTKLIVGMISFEKESSLLIKITLNHNK